MWWKGREREATPRIYVIRNNSYRYTESNINTANNMPNAPNNLTHPNNGSPLNNSNLIKENGFNRTNGTGVPPGGNMTDDGNMPPISRGSDSDLESGTLIYSGGSFNVYEIY